MTSKPRFLNPSTLSKPPGYSHVVEVAGPGHIVYIAGQLGIDREGKVVGAPGDFRAQAVQAFENLKIALAAVGASFEHVVKINNYLTDMSHLSIFREVRDRYLNIAAPPRKYHRGDFEIRTRGRAVRDRSRCNAAEVSLRRSRSIWRPPLVMAHFSDCPPFA